MTKKQELFKSQMPSKSPALDALGIQNETDQ